MNRTFVLGVAIFFIIHAALRLSVSQGLNYDEAEQALLVESFAWGYNLQPPLYTWLQIPWVALLGMNAAAFVIPKYLTTFLVFLAIYALGRRVLKNDAAAIAATLGLALFPEIGWEWLRERTHLILMSLACVLTLLVLLRLRDRHDNWGYVLMGLCVGCGVLTKYPFVIFAVAVFGAALIVRDLRPIVLDWRILCSAAVAALVLAPHALWLAEELDQIKPALATRVAAGADHPAGQVVATALAKMVLVVLPPVLVIGVIAGRHRLKSAWRRFHSREPLLQFFAMYFMLVVLLLVVAVLLIEATTFNTRWAQPFFVFVPIWLMIMLRGADWGLVARRVAVAGAAVALLLGSIFHMLVIGGPAFGIMSRLNDPFRELAAALPKVDGNILAENHYLGGNLKLWLEGTVVVTPQLGLRAEHLRPGSTLLVWNATRVREPPQALLELAYEHGKQLGTAVPVFLEQPYARSHGKSMRIGVLQL